MKKIRLVYLVSTLGRTGPTQQLYNLVKYLDHDHFDTTIVTLSKDPIMNFKREFANLGVAFQSLYLDRVRGFLFGSVKLKSLLTTLSPDIIHSQGLRADWLSAKLDEYPVRITTQRNNPIDDYHSLYGPIIGLAAARLHRRALKRIPIVVACSQSIKEAALQNELNSVVIRNGVEIDDLIESASVDEKAHARGELNLPKDGRLFVFAGPLISRKDPEFLVRAFINRTSRRDMLCMLGDGPLLSSCRRLAEKNENIFLPGEVSNVIDYFRVADLFVSASHAEGMPNAVLEALATGLPAILSDIPAHREILENCPDVGWLFDPGDLGRLCGLLDQVTNAAATGRNPQDSIKNVFSARTMSETYQQLYQRSL